MATGGEGELQLVLEAPELEWTVEQYCSITLCAGVLVLVCSSCAEILDYTTNVDLEKKGNGDAEQKTGEFSRLGVYNIMYNASTISFCKPVTLKP